MRRSRVAASIGLAAALFGTFGCGFSTGGDIPRQTYVYVAQAGPLNGTGKLAQFQLAENGTLIPLTPPSVPAGGASDDYASAVVVNPSGTNLFTENTDSQTISEFCIAQDGTLSSCSTFNFEFFSMAFVQNGSIGIVTNTTGLSSYRMNATGPPSLIGTLAGLGSSVVVDPSERFVYSVDESTSTISEYSISSSGALAPLAAPNTVATGWLPFAIAVSPRGFLYSVDYGAGTITEYAINSSTGALTKVDTFPTGQTIGLITSQPRWISFDPTGSFAYVGNVYDNTISQFTVDAPTGALTQNGADVSTTWAPLQVVVDPSGKFAFSADGDGKILEFTINTDGTLAPNGTLSLGGIYEGFPFGIMFARR